MPLTGGEGVQRIPVERIFYWRCWACLRGPRWRSRHVVAVIFDLAVNMLVILRFAAEHNLNYQQRKLQQ